MKRFNAEIKANTAVDIDVTIIEMLTHQLFLVTTKFLFQ